MLGLEFGIGMVIIMKDLFFFVTGVSRTQSNYRTKVMI